MDAIYNAYLMFRLSPHGGLPPVELSFLQLLRLTDRFNATDPRDVIFSLLGLRTKDHDPQGVPFFVADYNLSPEALFQAITEKFLKQLQPLKFLSNSDGMSYNEKPS